MGTSFNVFVLMFTASAVSQAAVLLGTDLPAMGDALTVGTCCFLSQPFTLTTEVNVTSIALQVAGTGVDPATIWLTDKIGPGASPSDVLFETNQTFPDNGGSTSGETVTLPTSLTLSAGDYFLVMSSTSLAVFGAGPRPGWLLATAQIPTSAGSAGSLMATTASSVDTSFPPASTFGPVNFGPIPVPSDVLAFRIVGTPTPEPPSVFSFGTAFVGLLVLRRIRF